MSFCFRLVQSAHTCVLYVNGGLFANPIYSYFEPSNTDTDLIRSLTFSWRLTWSSSFISHSLFKLLLFEIEIFFSFFLYFLLIISRFFLKFLYDIQFFSIINYNNNKKNSKKLKANTFYAIASILRLIFIL